MSKAAARTALTLREETALRFTTAIVAHMAYDILDSPEADIYRNVARSGFRLADAFLDVVNEGKPAR